MANERLRKFTFPTENSDLPDLPVEDKLANKLKDNRVQENTQFASMNLGKQRVQNDFEPVAPSPTRPTIANTDIFNPNTFEDAQRVADEILQGHNAIVNLEHLLNDEARRQDAMRIIDFICGVAYALKIEVKRVNAATFLFTIK